jgi:hypothetical protein
MSKALKVLVIHQESSKIEDLENFQNNRHGYQVQYVHCAEDLDHYKKKFTNDNFDGFLVQSNGNNLGKEIFKLVEQQKTTDAIKKNPFFIALSTGSAYEAHQRQRWLLDFADVVMDKKNESEILEQIITLIRARSSLLQLKSNKPKGLIESSDKYSKGGFLFNGVELKKDNKRTEWVSFKKKDQGTIVLNYLLNKPNVDIKEEELKVRVYGNLKKNSKGGDIINDEWNSKTLESPIAIIRGGIVEILMNDKWFTDNNKGKQLAIKFSEKIISEKRAENTYKYDNYITIEGFKEDES